MKSEYQADELLPLSGLQHFVFCRRQWALIHVERQWMENHLTVDGKIMHDRVDDPYFSETRNGLVITRSMPVASYKYGLIGVCDVVEFALSENGVSLKGRQGTYQPAPVEYKRGHQKRDRSDEAQLCAQALCLEEMLSIPVPVGFIYYGQTRHREEVIIDDELRQFVIRSTTEMHTYYDRGYTPRVKPSKACKSCSLQDVCLPVLQEHIQSASKYIQTYIDSE